MNTLWAIANGDGETHAFDGIGLTEFKDGPCRGYMEYQEVTPGIGVYRLEARARADFTLSAAAQAPAGMLILGCILNGSGRISAAGSDDQSWTDEGRLYAISPFGRQVNYHVSAPLPWRSMAIRVEVEAFARVANDDVPPQLRRAAEGKETLSITRPLLPAMARLAEELMRPVYAGAGIALYREAKVLEMLALQFDALSDEAPTAASLSAREATRIRQARDRLVADLRDPPGLHELAEAVGISTKRLNRGFVGLYGATVFEYLRNARLDAARRMLDEDLDLPLKQIAWRVGYSHATNFISAYRNRFGLPPGLHKRLRDDDD